jgi:hypothetical protein
MTDRELRVAIRQRFDALRIAVQQRRAELIAETEAELLDRCQAESERIEQLNRGLHEIIEEANRKLLPCFASSRYPGMEHTGGLKV